MLEWKEKQTVLNDFWMKINNQEGNENFGWIFLELNNNWNAQTDILGDSWMEFPGEQKEDDETEEEFMN